jgi:hypothetical protein
MGRNHQPQAQQSGAKARSMHGASGAQTRRDHARAPDDGCSASAPAGAPVGDATLDATLDACQVISSKMLGGASQIVSMVRVKCNGK